MVNHLGVSSCTTTCCVNNISIPYTRTCSLDLPYPLIPMVAPRVFAYISTRNLWRSWLSTSLKSKTLLLNLLYNLAQSSFANVLTRLQGEAISLNVNPVGTRTCDLIHGLLYLQGVHVIWPHHGVLLRFPHF